MPPRILEEISPESDPDACAAYGDSLPSLKNDLKTADQNVFSLIRGDIERQLGLASDRQNSMLQSIGILVAFASILFLQLLTMDPAFDGFGAFFATSIFSVLLCCLLGIFTILESRKFALSAGMNIMDEISRYNDDNAEHLETEIANGMIRAYEAAYHDNANLVLKIILIGALLLIGIITMSLGWCLR
jgi:hypothetical protein